MITIAFQPNSTTAPPFSALVTLDGVSYNLVAMWNLDRGDWYISLTDQTGNLIVNQPLIGSPPDADILLAPGIFTTSTLLYRPSTGNFEVSVVVPPTTALSGAILSVGGAPVAKPSVTPLPDTRGLGFGLTSQ